MEKSAPQIFFAFSIVITALVINKWSYKKKRSVERIQVIEPVHGKTLTTSGTKRVVKFRFLPINRPDPALRLEIKSANKIQSYAVPNHGLYKVKIEPGNYQWRIISKKRGRIIARSSRRAFSVSSKPRRKVISSMIRRENRHRSKKMSKSWGKRVGSAQQFRQANPIDLRRLRSIVKTPNHALFKPVLVKENLAISEIKPPELNISIE